ncbi:MAG TPA: hypothetical protein VLS89_12545, partial [Candidatus Nanopelagicales bacterium]|nr:hypothetical protein [Candidatus Nanopelagicales bacterium]
MIAILMDTLFEPVEETTLGLVALFEICADGRHVLLTNPTWKKSPRVDAWLGALPRRTRAEAERVLDRSIAANAKLARGTPRVRVDDVKACRWDGSPPVLDVKTALRLLRTPLRLLVENRFSDGAFVRKVLGPANRQVLDQAIGHGWVEIEQGG